MVDELTNSLIALNKHGDEMPVVFVHPAGGQIHWYSTLSKLFGKNRPFFALMSSGLLIDEYPLMTTQEMARVYIDFLEQKKIRMPCIIAGWSFGCNVAFEMTKLLIDKGHEIPLLILLDPQIMLIKPEQVPSCFLLDVLEKEFNILLPPEIDIEKMTNVSLENVIDILHKQVLLKDAVKKMQLTQYLRAIRVYLFNMFAMSNYLKEGTVSRIFLMLAENDKLYSFLKQATTIDWKDYAKEISQEIIPGDHYSMLYEQSAQLIVNRIKQLL